MHFSLSAIATAALNFTTVDAFPRRAHGTGVAGSQYDYLTAPLESEHLLRGILLTLDWGVFKYAAWRHISSTYVLASGDISLGVPWAKMMIEQARNANPTAFGKVEHVDAGHFLMISVRETVAEILERAAQ